MREKKCISCHYFLAHVGFTSKKENDRKSYTYPNMLTQNAFLLLSPKVTLSIKIQLHGIYPLNLLKTSSRSGKTIFFFFLEILNG